MDAPKKKIKPIKIQTLEDLFRATTNENFENLASCIVSMMDVHIHLKKHVGKRRYNKLIFGQFEYSEDDKNEITLTYNGQEMKFETKYQFTR